MKLRIYVNKFKMDVSALSQLAMFLYLCSPFVNLICRKLFSLVRLGSAGDIIGIALIYVPVILIGLINPKRIPLDFLGVLVGVCVIFGVSYWIHPEYKYWYERSFYGVWDYVLRPDNGIYLYLFIRLVDDPKKILKTLKMVSWVMIPFCIPQLLEALRRGYWEATGLSYNLAYGYNVLFFTLVFLYYAVKDRKVADIGMTILGCCMIFLGGSRGPLACVLVFIVLYFTVMANGRMRYRNAVIIVVFGVIVLFFYEPIIRVIASVVERFGLNPRTLIMLLENNITDDTGRDLIWKTTVQMIRENPFGYGAMGTRPVIFYLIDVGHPHQLFLEILVDFGIFVGGAIVVFLVVNTFRIFAKKTDDLWKSVFLIVFCRACQMMVSGTYWHVASFWGCIAIGVSLYLSEKRKVRING